MAINTASLKVIDGGQIAVSTAGIGKGGELAINANEIETESEPIIPPYHAPEMEVSKEVPADLPKLSVVEDNEYEDDDEYEYEEDDESAELNLNTEALDEFEDDDDDDDEGGVPSIPKAG